VLMPLEPRLAPPWAPRFSGPNCNRNRNRKGIGQYGECIRTGTGRPTNTRQVKLVKKVDAFCKLDDFGCPKGSAILANRSSKEG